jgi:hypothetical protein
VKECVAWGLTFPSVLRADNGDHVVMQYSDEEAIIDSAKRIDQVVCLLSDED